LKASTVIVSTVLHVGLAASLITVAERKGLGKKTIQVAVTRDEKKKDQPKPPPPKPIAKPAAPKVVAKAEAPVAAELAGQLERRLVGLRPRVAEEDPLQRRGAARRQPLGERNPGRVAHGGGVEQELARLLGDGPHDIWMAVAGRGDGMAAVGVEPFDTVLVDEPGPAATNRADRELAVDGEKGGWAHGRTGAGIFRRGFGFQRDQVGCSAALCSSRPVRRSARQHGYIPTPLSPIVSSSPSARFMA